MDYHYERIARLFFASWDFLITRLGALFASLSFLDAKTVMALDRLTAPVVVLAGMRSRFDAFVTRALGHDKYTSGHFDPGRCAA